MPGDLRAYWRRIVHAQEFHVRVTVREGCGRAIELGRRAIVRSHGEIADFRMFGDRCLSMLLEMDGRGVLALVDALAALGWDVDVDPAPEALAARADRPLRGTFQLAFPRLARERAVPVPVAG